MPYGYEAKDETYPSDEVARHAMREAARDEDAGVALFLTEDGRSVRMIRVGRPDHDTAAAELILTVSHLVSMLFDGGIMGYILQRMVEIDALAQHDGDDHSAPGDPE